MKWPADVGLSVTSRLLDSLMEPCRVGRSVRLWIILYTPVPYHKMLISRNIASALMRRRSQQLLSRLLRFRNFSGFSAVHHPEILEFQRLLPHRISINVGTDSQFVLTSHQQLLQPLRQSRLEMRWLSRDSKLLPELVGHQIVSQKVVIRYLVQQRVPRTLLSEIVRPSPEAAELLSVSAPLAAAAT